MSSFENTTTDIDATDETMYDDTIAECGDENMDDENVVEEFMNNSEMIDEISFIVNMFKDKTIDLQDSAIVNKFNEKIAEYKKWDHDIFKDIWKFIDLPINERFDQNSSSNLDYSSLFQNSTNGIYDFIVSGVSFGSIQHIVESYDSFDVCYDSYINDNNEHGIILLKIYEELYYAYFKFEGDSCPTCGHGFDSNYTKFLCISKSLYNVIFYGMNQIDRSEMSDCLECIKYINTTDNNET